MRVVGRRVDLENALEGTPRRLVLAGVVVRAAERLEDARLPGLEPVRPLQDDHRLGVMARGEQRLPALEQLVRGLALFVVVADLIGHGVMVA